MKLKIATRYLNLLPIFLMVNIAWAEEPRKPSMSAVLTGTALTTDNSQISSEYLSSMDLVGILPLGNGDLNVHVEGATTVADDGVSAMIGESNGDAGSAADRDGEGRLQISELFYALPLFGNATMSIGMLDATAGLDTSDVANDETTQFLAGPLINNPTIGFPDYTIGIAINSEPESMGLGYNLFLGSSDGLADEDRNQNIGYSNNNNRYNRLFQLNREGKGIFAAAEGVWKGSGLTARLGMWINTADHAHLNPNPTDLDATSNNYGIYGVLNGSMDTGTWGIRAGWADPEVSEANWSLGVAMEYPINGVGIAGVGFMYTGVSNDLRNNPGENFVAADGMMVAEVYLRLDHLTDHLAITPLIQYVDNSGFNSSETAPTDVWIFGVRANVELP